MMSLISRIASSCVAVALLFACSTDRYAVEPSDGLSVLALNLHIYQEVQTEGIEDSSLTTPMAEQRVRDYAPVFDRIASGIDTLDPDIVCLQEVAEWRGQDRDYPESIPFGATESNMVHQILARVSDADYEVTMDWSHYAWDVWIEGSAILSKYPIVLSDSRIISSDNSSRYESWKARNVPMAIVETPAAGRIAVFSVHAGWWDDPDEPARAQYANLLEWASEIGGSVETIILCGDFNAPAGGPGYRFLTTGTGFSDAYLRANPDGMFDATIGAGDDGWESSETGQRIDYVFVSEDSPFEVTSARRVFTEETFGRVSDHLGVYAEFWLARGLTL